MTRKRFHLDVAWLSALALTGSMLALHGCSTKTTDEPVQLAVTGDGSSTPISQLPFIDAASNAPAARRAARQAHRARRDHGAAGPAAAAAPPRARQQPGPRDRRGRQPARRLPLGRARPARRARQEPRAGLLHRVRHAGARRARPPQARRRPDRVRSVRQADAASRCCSAAAPRSRAPTSRRSTRRSSWRASRSAVNHCSVLPIVDAPGLGPVAVHHLARRSCSIRRGPGTRAPARAPRAASGRSPTSCARWRMARARRRRTSSRTGCRCGSTTTRSTATPSWRAPQMFNQVILPWATASGVTATLVTDPVTGIEERQPQRAAQPEHRAVPAAGDRQPHRPRHDDERQRHLSAP